MEMKMKIVIVFGVLALVFGSAHSRNIGNSDVATTITCGEAVTRLMSCGVFLSGPAASPSLDCCLAASNLNTRANSPATRKSVCECFKGVAPSFGVKVEKAMKLPQLCNNLQLPVPIDPKVNCNSIQF